MTERRSDIPSGSFLLFISLLNGGTGGDFLQDLRYCTAFSCATTMNRSPDGGRFFCFVVTSFASCLDFISRYSSTVICTVTIALLPHSCLPIITDFNKFHIIKAMSIRELTWQIKLVVLEAQNFTSILPSLRIFSLKTYEISDLGQNYNKSYV